MKVSKYYLSWKWVEEQIDSTIDKFNDIDLQYVSGVPRGGLIPAVMMSHILGVKYLPYTSAILLPEEIRNQTLVIDDIADTGHTLLEAKELFNRIDYNIQTKIFQNCEHRIPQEGSSLGLEFIKKKFY